MSSISSVLDLIARGSVTGANCVQIEPDKDDPNYVTIRNSKKPDIVNRLPLGDFEALLHGLKADKYDAGPGLNVEVLMTHPSWPEPLRFTLLEGYHFVGGALVGEFDVNKLNKPQKRRHLLYRLGMLIQRIGRKVASL